MSAVHATKRELQSQLDALQEDVSSLAATIYGNEKNANPTIADVLEDSGGIDNPPHPTSSLSQISIPAGASTLLSQLARTQRALQEMKNERDELAEQNRKMQKREKERKDRDRPRSYSPSSAETVKMRELYISLEKDHELLRLSLENSEKIRLQQKELIHLLQNHRVSSCSNGARGSRPPRRSQSPGGRRGTSPGPGKSSTRRTSSQSPDPRNRRSMERRRSKDDGSGSGKGEKMASAGGGSEERKERRSKSRTGSDTSSGTNSPVTMTRGDKGTISGLRRTTSNGSSGSTSSSGNGHGHSNSHAKISTSSKMKN